MFWLFLYYSGLWRRCFTVLSQIYFLVVFCSLYFFTWDFKKLLLILFLFHLFLITIFSFPLTFSYVTFPVPSLIMTIYSFLMLLFLSFFFYTIPFNLYRDNDDGESAFVLFYFSKFFLLCASLFCCLEWVTLCCLYIGTHDTFMSFIFLDFHSMLIFFSYIFVSHIFSFTFFFFCLSPTCFFIVKIDEKR